MRVIVADASAVLRGRLCGLLAEVPGAVLAGCGADAEEALLLVARARPDVVLVGAGLPHGGALDLVRAVRAGAARGGARGAAAIAVASCAPPQYRSRFAQAGARHFFDLPRDTDLLLAALAVIQEELS